MLTKRQNLLETIRGGQPDRFVNQYEALAISFGVAPLSFSRTPRKPGDTWTNAWGITQNWAIGTPGPMPVHDGEHIVMHDITKWCEQVNAPVLKFTDEQWQPLQDFAAGVDRYEQFCAMAMLPGLLEQLHHMMGMEGAMMAMALEPEAVAEFMQFQVDWEIAYASQIIEHIHPDALFHHDDWGSAKSTLVSPAMFAEIMLPAYKRLYGFYKSNGIELIVHHSDSYAATLVPLMIEMGIDIWQGVMSTNDIPALISQYGGQISFMGGIDDAKVDVEGWTQELIAVEVERACRANGSLYYIPGILQGMPTSTFPGVYAAVSREIDRMSTVLF
ncbi:MAG: hypothetical protein LBR39_01085 [Coriobacteriales bacterium]|jgi:hypothetical protein|nr:hypothetical protein [Coriobacteriales bacterium]